MKKYTGISELISNLEEQILEAQKLISALKVAPTTKEQIVLLKYIQTRSTPKTALFMRETGIHSPTGKSFQAPDVSAVIESGHESLDPVLLNFAQRTFSANKKAVSRRRY